jgi:hypothetical protein
LTFYEDVKSVIEYEDKQKGAIIGNGSTRFPATSGLHAYALHDYRTTFTMRVDMKDGKFRCTFSNIRITWPASYDRYLGARAAGDRAPRTGNESENIKSELFKIAYSLRDHITKSKKTDNW